jgi:GT2 family glycosyltransferase
MLHVHGGRLQPAEQIAHGAQCGWIAKSRRETPHATIGLADAMHRDAVFDASAGRGEQVRHHVHLVSARDQITGERLGDEFDPTNVLGWELVHDVQHAHGARSIVCAVPAVSVIIPTTCGLRWLPECIAALRMQTYTDFDVVVVDNASADGSREWLASQPDLRVLRNDANIGFAAAVNQGIRAGTAPLVALLNDDTRAEPDWLGALLEGMSAEGGGAIAEGRTRKASDRACAGRDASHRPYRIGMCASLMLFADRPDMVQSAGIAMDRAAFAWDRLGGRPMREALQPCDVFGPSGGAGLYRREMLDEIGLFDERFFAYLEDVDLAWRAQRAGWRCRYVPAARVLHATSATSGEGSQFKNRLLARNKVWLAAKNARLRDLPIIALYDAAASLYAGMRRGDWVQLRARWEGLSHPAGREAGAGDATPPFDPLVAPWHVPRRIEHLRPDAQVRR